MSARVWIAIIVIAAACGGGGGKDPAVCRREAAELSRLLSTMDHEMPGFSANGLSLVTRSDLPPTSDSYGPTVAIRAGDVTYDGRPFDAPETLDAIARATEDGYVVYVAIDEAAPWERVARTFARLEELGVTRLALAFEKTPTPVTKPPRSWIDDDLDRLQASDDGASKATELARMTGKIIKGCRPLEEAFGAVPGVMGDSKALMLIRTIEPSLVTCNCNLDLPAFRSIMFRLLHVAKPQSSFHITLDASVRAISLPPATPWREAHTHFTADVWDSVRAP